MTGTKLRTELLLFSLFTTLELEETVTSVKELLDELNDVEDAFTLFDDRELLEEVVLDDGTTTFVLKLEDLLFDELELSTFVELELLEELITFDELELEEDFPFLDELELDCEDELTECDELDKLDSLDELDELTASFWSGTVMFTAVVESGTVTGYSLLLILYPDGAAISFTT